MFPNPVLNVANLTLQSSPHIRCLSVFV
ncbi:hypothetical protein NC652_039471 [Populus alba x Populus x berolinensis]|nr:hypothetical protein NC652_039465 [Populus alba x Populus x berolinensis]KAJ6862618.1 hypothetical protein NC652_039467 [Populus alba x Populus x berolinensis]KAJ6862622.1 hypothetical protein NC652_039471 [Populus alba x Populus x berolinensis]